MQHNFKNLKRQGLGVIDLDSPSPAKRVRSAPSVMNPVMNPDHLPGLATDEDGDYTPAFGERDDSRTPLT